MRRNARGFTLMELLIVISIVAILISISAASYATANRHSRDTKRKADIEQLRSALEMYRTDNGYYANAGSGNWTDASNLSFFLVDTYIPAIPADPKQSQTYRYQATKPSAGNYYGYCLSALLEAENPVSTCTPDTVNSHNYGIKNP